MILEKEGPDLFRFKIAAANRGQHCTTAKCVIPVVIFVSWADAQAGVSK